MSRREQEREFKKKLIADAAFQLFTANSYETVTMDDIARASEFGKGTLYQYFSGKEEILFHIVYKGIEQLLYTLEQNCLDIKNAEEALRHYIRLQYEFNRNYNNLFLSLLKRQLEDQLNPEWFAAIRQLKQKKSQIVSYILAEGMQKGVFMPADPLILARIIDALVKGWTIEGLENTAAGRQKDEELAAIIDFILYGIAARIEKPLIS